jgi:hypothetical protein
MYDPVNFNGGFFHHVKHIKIFNRNFSVFLFQRLPRMVDSMDIGGLGQLVNSITNFDA